MTMELPKLKHANMEKFSPLKYRNQFPSRDGLILKSLQNENLFIKKKLAEFESRLDLYPSAVTYDRFHSQSINAKNESIETPQLRKIKSARQPLKRIDAFLNPDTIRETNEPDVDLKEDLEEFKIPDKSFSRLNSARTNTDRLNSSRINSSRINSSRLSTARLNSARNDECISRLKSASRERTPSALRNMSDFSNRISSARTLETYTTNSTKTNDSALDKIEEVLENLKKHRRSPMRKRVVEENIKLRPKTTNVPKTPDNKSESAKKKNRSKSAKKSAKKEDYQHMFYSNSWRIHSEFVTEEPDRNAPWDNTTSLFYKTKRKMPETFIFAPDWI